MATVALQHPYDALPRAARRITGDITGKAYSVDGLGRAVVDVLDSYNLLARGWLYVNMGDSTNQPTAGVTTVNFGAFPGAPFATVTVPAVDVFDPNAVVDVFIVPIATSDHSADEHVADPPLVNGYADGNGNIIIEAIPSGRDLIVPPGTAFGNKTAGTNYTGSQMPVGQPNPMPVGKWSVGWAFIS